MRRAARLALRGWGRVSPNPLVGAYVVKDGRLVGRGYHHRAGEAHAEVNALRDAGKEAESATIYVTLEPCSTHGRTPPCVEAILRSGISRVVVGELDVNPLHSGAGVEILMKEGLEVTVGIEEDICASLNESFSKWILTSTPFVVLKMAMTLDGKIATCDGKSKWITGPLARRRVQRLRQWADAILVGGETARADHPSLTVRSLKNWRQPRRLIASRSLDAKSAFDLLPKGQAPEVVDLGSKDKWRDFLCKLGSENVTALLIEGGGELAESALRAELVDRVDFHIAPKILGGRDSRPVIGGENPLSLDSCKWLERVTLSKAGDDIIVSGFPVAKKQA